MMSINFTKGKQIVNAIRDRSRSHPEELAAIKNNEQFSEWVANLPEAQGLGIADAIALGMFLGSEQAKMELAIEQRAAAEIMETLFEVIHYTDDNQKI